MCLSRAKPERRLRTRLARQAVLSGGLVSLAAACVVLALTYLHLTRQMARPLVRVTNDLLAEYAESQRGDESGKSFFTHMDEDAEERDTARFFVLLADGQGGLIYATPMPEPIRQSMLDAAKVGADGHVRRTLVAWRGRARRCALRRCATPLPDGNVIVVAVDGTPHETFFFIVLGVLGGASLLATLLAGFGAFLFGTRLERRLAAIAAAAEAIAAGDWSRRVSAHGEVREVENLVRLFNLMCDHNERTLNELRVLTDNIAHDLRTPLTRLALAAESEPSGDGARSLADAVTEETSAMLDMIDVMLEISRTDAKIETSPRVELDVSVLVEETVALFRPLAADRGVELAFAAPDGPVCYSGHRAKFQRLLGNLTENAVKFTPAGGQIAWSVARLPGGGVRLAVSDTGCGIAADDIPHVFTRFWRADSSRHCPGNGLGLALVKAIATSYGGSVVCESTLGKGTTFTVTLP